MDDGIGENLCLNAKTDNNLGTLGSVTNQVPLDSTIDECETPVGGRIQGFSYRGSNQDLVPVFNTWAADRLSFTLGMIIKAISGGQNITSLYQTDSVPYVKNAISGGTITTTVAKPGPDITYTVPGFDYTTTGGLLIISMSMNPATGEHTIDYYTEDGLFATRSGTTGAVPTQPQVFFIGTGGGTGSEDIRVKDVGYLPVYSTAEEIQPLLDAWAQNKNTYVDPNPNCVPIP